MFSEIKRALSSIDVTERGNQVKISGLPANVFLNDVYKMWGTSKIEQFLFNSVKRSEVAFHSFFAPDVLFLLKTLHDKHKRKHNYRAVEKIVNMMLADTWLRETVNPNTPGVLDFKQLSNLKLNLLSHQQEFLEAYDYNVPRMNLRGYLLAARPGSGKTIASLALAECLKVDHVIMVVPNNSVESVWVKTLNSLYKQPREIWSTAENGKPTAGKFGYVVHYEYLNKAIDELTALGLRNVAIIVDECHNFNTEDSQRTVALLKLVNNLNCKHTLFMSGTPFKAVGAEAVPLLTVIDPFFDENVKNRFIKIFGKNASRANDILRNRLTSITYKASAEIKTGSKVVNTSHNVVIPKGERYTLESVRTAMTSFIKEQSVYYRKNMPAYVAEYKAIMSQYLILIGNDQNERKRFITYRDYVETIRVKYDPVLMKEQVKYCNEYELKSIIPRLPKEQGKRLKEIRSIYKYVDLKIMGEALGRILGRLRTQCNVEMVAHTPLAEMIDGSNTKTVIFTYFVEVVDTCFNKLVADGYTPLRVYGKTNHDLANIIKRFAEEEDVNPLIATFDSLSTAVPLVMASTIVMMNQPYRSWEREQAVARIDRIGQTEEECQVIDVLLDTGKEPNISTRSKDIMDWSAQMVEQILGFKNVATDVVALEGLCVAVLPDDVQELALAKENPKPSFAQW